MGETLDEMMARHKKELKSFEGERRASIRKAKSRGKKAKTAVKEAEFKYDGLGRDLKQRHKAEIENLGGGSAENDPHTEQVDFTILGGKVRAGREDTSGVTAATPPNEEQHSPALNEESRRKNALQKKLKKKSAKRQKEIDRERRIEEENAAAGPSRRQMEMEALLALQLHPQGLEVQEIKADGNCLYRAVAAQCHRLGLRVMAGVVEGEDCYKKIREMCADVLEGQNRAEYEQFAECGDGLADANGGLDQPQTFEEYVSSVRSSSVWGGQLELRALSEGLRCPIVVFSAEGPPLTMGSEYALAALGESGGDNEGWKERRALLLSFHRHYYALGEHYNSVVPK